MNPKVILFDLGDVVCRFVPERRLELLAAACGTSPQDVREALYGTGLVDLWDQGGATAGRIHETVRSELGFKGGQAELERLWCAAFDPDHEVLRLVRASRPCRTALFTNNDALLLSALPRVMPQVAECFDKLVFSCELGAKKPDSRAFEQALSEMSADPADAVFIDDKAENVSAAGRLGIPGVRFRGADALTETWKTLFPM
ncbi:HAD-IA family hydrolase [Streptomyces virginiae]|uniref:HAD-IA family hydrolase n=1 Tax=Streptomyces virginiae TaxID=1961 RepID=UPI00371428CA